LDDIVNQVVSNYSSRGNDDNEPFV
jgi:hypothetical protein